MPKRYAMSDYQDINDSQTEVLERQKIKTPPLYKVFLLNDDYTTMDFVVHILEKIFSKSSVEAAQIMLHVHKNGKGLAGIYSHEVAETKIDTVHQMSAKNGYPLKCSMEKE